MKLRGLGRLPWHAGRFIALATAAGCRSAFLGLAMFEVAVNATAAINQVFADSPDFSTMMSLIDFPCEWTGRTALVESFLARQVVERAIEGSDKSLRAGFRVRNQSRFEQLIQNLLGSPCHTQTWQRAGHL
jgi:hypothetical protein